MSAKKAEAPKGKLGVLVVGCGAVATTFMTGVLMVRKGLAKPVGSMTQYDKIRVGKGADNTSISTPSLPRPKWALTPLGKAPQFFAN